MNIKLGDIIETIDDSLKGKVMLIKENTIVFETDDGFEIEAEKREIIKVDDISQIQVNNMDVFNALSDKNLNTKKKKLSVKRSKTVPPMEVDLHIGQLAKNIKGMKNHDMLTLQLETAKRQLEFAINKRIQKVVFIHGVGEGVLKIELEYLFKRYDNVRCYDADYQKYGLGATEVYIHQNVN